MSSNSNKKGDGKRKEGDRYDMRGRKKKTSEIQLLSRCNQLLESISTKSDSTSVNLDREGCSIREVTAELHSISGVSIEDEFHDFATEYLSLRRKREMWTSMGDKEQKLRWLQRMYAHTKRAQMTWYYYIFLTVNQLTIHLLNVFIQVYFIVAE